MPARGMGQAAGNGNAATPSAKAVLMSPFSGPTGSPYDTDEAGNASTGALCTGIGFGIGSANDISPGNIRQGFNDNYTPGVTMPDNTVAPDARLTAIGGGRSNAAGVSTPWNALELLAFGNGASRDATAALGFGMKLVTAAAPVAHAGVIETGFTNRVAVGYTLPTGNSAFGSSVAASPTPV